MWPVRGGPRGAGCAGSVTFHNRTPAALLAQPRPDVWVKGGDYTVSDLPEAPVVTRYGGRIVIIPLIEGFSTSRLVSAALAEP
ncbi:MAG: hypothetical protein ACRDTJ_11840 [Pseudonocardiaceae bacterium]